MLKKIVKIATVIRSVGTNFPTNVMFCIQNFKTFCWEPTRFLTKSSRTIYMQWSQNAYMHDEQKNKMRKNDKR